MSPRAYEIVATLGLLLGFVAVCLPWFLLTCFVVCGVWREKKESDVHLGVRVEQVPLVLTLQRSK